MTYNWVPSRSERQDILQNSPKAVAVLADIARQRRSLAHKTVRKPTFADITGRADILQVIVGECLSGWDYRSPEADADIPERAAEISESAALISDAEAAKWWWRPIDRDRQTIVADDIEDAVHRIAEAAARNANWQRTGLLTTTSTWLSDDLPAAQLSDPGFVARDRQEMRCWRVRVRPDARVFDVRNRADYLALCSTYPLVTTTPHSWRSLGVTTDQILVPDWAAIGREWDGVHLSVSGQLGATGVPLAIDGRTAMWLEADSEMTFWFNNVLEPGLELASVSTITARW